MLQLEDFRQRMKTEVEKTREIQSVRVSGRNLNDALKQAALELSLPVSGLEYEILNHRSGIFGFKRSPCRILAYKVSPVFSNKKTYSQDSDYDTDNMPELHEIHGRLSVRLAGDGAWVKVFPPNNEGLPVSIEDAQAALSARQVRDIDDIVLSIAIKQADMMWIKVGDFDHNPKNDAAVTLEVTHEDTKAFIRVSAPGVGGLDLSADDLRGFLAGNRVIYGINDKVLGDFENFPVYNSSVLVAEGKKAVNGDNARLECDFDTQPDRIKLHEREDGSVDFKELNRYQNVVEGQPVARKIPPTKGEDGQTVYGQLLLAEEGKDIELNIGKNLILSDDGLTAIATISGHVIVKSGVINVENILVIPGNVDAKTGNINILCSVSIKGNVEDGFSVTAEGKIEVFGYVGNANLNAGGDIIVSRGINGGEGTDSGQIIAAKNIWSSFIQNAHAKAGESIIVSAGIVNSDVTAQKKILCKGYRAKIVGGHVRAAQEVNAVTLGAISGTKTIIEVGSDGEIGDEMDQFKEKHDVVNREMEESLFKLRGLKRLAKMHPQQLSKEKLANYNELRLKYEGLQEELNDLDENIAERTEYLEFLARTGSISASRKVFSGVRLFFRDVEYRVKEAYDHSVTFLCEDHHIKITKYQQIEEDLTRR